MKNKIVRIKDIAEKAGVSTGTVDRVIHNRGRVAEDIKNKVLSIIEELHYEPNYEARALGSNKAYKIVVLLPDFSIDPYWYDPKMGVDKAEHEFAQYGLSVERLYFSLESEESFVEQAKKIVAMAPDGIVLAPVFKKEALPFLAIWKRSKIPVVTFNTQLEGAGLLSFVGQNSVNSGRLAARLIHYGYAKESGSVLIAHVDEDYDNSMHLKLKEQGFRAYFEENGLTEQYNIKRIELKRRDYLAFVRKLSNMLDASPDLKVIYVSNSKAFEIATYLEQQGIENVHIIGYDLVPRNVSFIRKGIISFVINQHPRGQGYRAVSLLADHLIFKKRVQPLKFLPLDIITNENLEYFLEEGYMK